ncbi:TAFII55 protein conserved region-domain-containing protein [Xylogone sp. PMI_703]|nr:TAFII55 protein conserved region-domain-containing protein [Xylogone sp. PMI_703]
MSGLKLKLNLNTGSAISKPPTPGAATPGGTTPALTPGGSRPKLKLTNKSNPSTPSVPAAPEIPVPKKTKAGRAPKPSAKLVEQNRKRLKDESGSEADESTIAVIPPQKKIKIQLSAGPKTPVVTPGHGVVLKAKVKGKPPKRPLGEGYDSEASDREIDPAIEEEFVLRMVPGDDCEYLKRAIADKKIGIPKSQGGADVHMKFYHAEGRRAAVIIRGRVYAATLVDLPCVIEGMKSWDKRGWWKSADICQMLWAFARVKNEEEAKTIPLPKIIDPVTFQYPHGLTPPMYYARKRRFRKRISRTAIEAVEDAVEKLLQADAAAESTRFEILDPDAEDRRSQAFSPGATSQGEYEQYSAGEEDAEGDVDDTGYFSHAHIQSHTFDNDIDADLEADLEAAMQAEAFENTPISTPEPSTAFAGTGSRAESTLMSMEADQEASGDESVEGSDEEDDDDGSEAGGVDEDEKARLAQLQGVREDIIDLQRQLEFVQGSLAAQQNPILRRRLEDNARKLMAELQLKKSAIGEGEDD